MNLFSFWKKKNRSDMVNKGVQNPYVKGMEGRKEWDDRYFNMTYQLSRWQHAFMISMLITLVMTAVAAKLATQSRIKPVVVEVCNNQTRAILPVTDTLPNEDRLVDYAIKQFIINSHTIITDPDAQKTLLNQVYAYSADHTIRFLHDYYTKNNPFELALHTTMQTYIINTMKISPHTWQITWEQITKNPTDNEVIAKTRWIATVTYRMGEVNPKFINENPFGIYVSQLSWSQLTGQQG